MDAESPANEPFWSRPLGIAFGLGTQAVFAVTVWRLFCFLRDGNLLASEDFLLVDLALAIQFVVPHSVLLLPGVRSRLTRRFPSALYGSLFCVATCAGLWLIFAFWRASPLLVWRATGVAAAAIRSAFYASWVALFYSIRLTGFGYQTGWTQWKYWFRRQPLPRRDFVERGAYRWLRHPVYLSFLGLIWFTPRMTVDHAVLTAVWTGYVFMGSILKDQRLAFFLGDAYREYASRVPGYPGMLLGPLAKWKRPGAVPLGAKPELDQPPRRRAA